MRMRLLSVLVMSAIFVVLLACKNAGPKPPFQSAGEEPRPAAPNTTPEPQVTPPKGKGVLTVLVEDETGKPIEGAEIWIANKRGETFKTKSRKDGTTKGAGPAFENPFSVTVTLAGYEGQQAQGITLSEEQPVFITVKLKRAGK